jgi:hypothetical protein
VNEPESFTDVGFIPDNMTNDESVDAGHEDAPKGLVIVIRLFEIVQVYDDKEKHPVTV